MGTLERVDLDGVTVLKLVGSLNSEGLEAVEPLFKNITHQPGVRTVVDLTGVDIVTTPAISMFLDAAKVAKTKGGRIVFTESRPPVRDMLKRLRLHSVLHTVTGLDQAIATARTNA
jgi:anti-anti-sigma factor